MARWKLPNDEREGFVLPRIEIPELGDFELTNPRISDYGRSFLPMAGGASFSDYAELKVLDLFCNAVAFATPTTYLGLWTSALTDASTSATAGELTYT